MFNAFKKAGIDLSGHAIKRLRDIRAKNLGFKILNDIMRIYSKGSIEKVEKIVTRRNGERI